MGLLQALNLAATAEASVATGTGPGVLAALAPVSRSSLAGATPVSIAILKPGPFEPGSQKQLAAIANDYASAKSSALIANVRLLLP